MISLGGGKGVSHRRTIDDMKCGDQGNNPKNENVIYEETASYQRQKLLCPSLF